MATTLDKVTEQHETEHERDCDCGGRCPGCDPDSRIDLLREEHDDNARW